MTPKEERVWRYILNNRSSSVETIADECGVTEHFAESLVSRIGSENWRETLKKENDKCT